MEKNVVLLVGLIKLIGSSLVDLSIFLFGIQVYKSSLDIHIRFHDGCLTKVLVGGCASYILFQGSKLYWRVSAGKL
jgi:hypothetical protein